MGIDTTLHYKNVVGIFEEQATLQAEKIALVHESENITYQQLNEQANQLAHYLMAVGVNKGTLVTICLEQSINRPLFMLAVMKVGAVYIPLDPEYPEARINFILENSQSTFLLTSKKLLSKFSSFQGKVIVPEDYKEKIATNDINKVRISILPSDLVYVIYTSGSTGTPKGVAVQHSAVLSFTENYPRIMGVSEKNITLQLLSYAFDASFIDLWIPLIVGATIHLYPDNKVIGAPLLEYIKQHLIDTIMVITPTLLATLPTEEPIGNLRKICVAGEVCPENVFLYWANKVKIYNAYGPTETTIAVTCHEYQAGECVRTIGKPLPGVEFYVLDSEFQQTLPVGEAGELFVGGAQLAKEYLHRPDLTAERFLYVDITDRLANETKPKRLYKTGDIVRRLPDNNLEFIGRNDTQLKVRGFRIESAEIENVINAMHSIKESAVVAINTEHGQPILAAFITLQNSQIDDELRIKADIRQSLKKTLPSYMIPDKIIFLDSLPTVANGKVDRKALQTTPIEEYLSLEGISEEDVEGIICAVWRHVLQSPDVKYTDNFFELGGHSLGVVRVLMSLPEFISKALQLVDLYLYPTIQELAAEIRARRNKTPLTFEEKMKVSTEILLNDIQLEADYDYPTDINPNVLANPKKIFLTGCTGFVGVHLLLELLDTTSADIYCLIRAENAAHAIERIKFTLSKYRMPWPEAKAQRIIPVLGDFTLQFLGLPEDDYIDLANAVEIIYHTGGNVNYIKPYPIMKAVNVDGIQEIIRFATTDKLKYLVTLSTIAIFSWGHIYTGKTWMYEEEDIDQNLPTICRDTNYVRSKWVMEKILAKTIQKGLPVIRIRLGFVMCNGITGATEMNQWWGSFVRCCISLGTYPMIMGLKDQLVTVDFVAKAIAHISKNKDAIGKHFHLIPPPVYDLSIPEFFLKLSEIFNLNLVPVHYHEWLNLWKDNENSPMYSLLSLFTEEVVPGKSLVEVYEMTYYFERQNTDAFLKGSGIETPLLTKELLAKYLDYMGVTAHKDKVTNITQDQKIPFKISEELLEIIPS